MGLCVSVPDVAAGPRPQGPRRPERRQSATVRLLDVPFVAQSEALCGGAAVAMLARYWGRRDVYVEDFAGLVNPQARGIPTEALTEATLRLGWSAIPFRGTERSVREHLARGRPLIVLVRESPDRYHYLVVVGWLPTQVIVHDPARAPFRVLDVEAFHRGWAAADFWTLLALPPSAPSDPEPAAPSLIASMDLAPACHAAVSQGVAHARRAELTQAETALLAAQARCPDASAPLRELAGLRILQARWTDANALARRAVERDPADAHAWRLLATIRFSQGNPSGALDAWNHLGEPAIDLVQIEGLSRTRHTVVEDVLGLARASTLTESDLGPRPAWRVTPPDRDVVPDQLPATGRRADVEVAVSERPLFTTDFGHLAAAGMRAATERTLQVDAASATGNGELWSASWRWWEARPRFAFSLHTPAPRSLPGTVWQIEAAWERQTFSDVPHSTSALDNNMFAVEEARRRVSLTVEDWKTPDLYWDATAALDEWSATGRYLALGAGLERHAERVVAGINVAGWTGLDGGQAFARWTLFSAWRSSKPRPGLTWTARGAVEAVTPRAPLTLWPGAGLGHVSRVLLRAHPLLDEGVITRARLGRQLVGVTIEAEHTWRQMGPLRLRVVGFADSARAWRSASREGTSRTDVDVGVGVRLSALGHVGRLRVDLARGLQDGALAASVGWELPWPHLDF